MTEFHELEDEFAGEESNREWDAAWAAYTSGDRPDVAAGLLPLLGRVALPVGTVEVRGESSDVACALADLDDLSSESGDIAAIMNVEVNGDLPAWHLASPSREPIDAAEGVMESACSASAFLSTLIEATAGIDEDRVYLSGSCLDFDGVGMLIFSESDELRRTALDDLLAKGGRCIAVDTVFASPGTLAVRGVGDPTCSMSARGTGTHPFTRVGLVAYIGETCESMGLDTFVFGCNRDSDPAQRVIAALESTADTLRMPAGSPDRLIEVVRRSIGSMVASPEANVEIIRALDELLDGAAAYVDQVVLVGQLVDLLDSPLPTAAADIDRIELLVPSELVPALAALLEAQGWEREPIRLAARGQTSVSSVVLGGESKPAVVLHRSLGIGPFGELVDPQDFHELAVPVKVGRNWVHALNPVHRFVHACLRAVESGAADESVRHSILLNAPRGGREISAMLDAAERWGVSRTVCDLVGEIEAMTPGSLEEIHHLCARPPRRSTSRWRR